MVIVQYLHNILYKFKALLCQLWDHTTGVVLGVILFSVLNYLTLNTTPLLIHVWHTGHIHVIF